MLPVVSHAAAAGQTGPSPGVWQVLSPAPTKRTEVAAAAIGGKIYVVGGFDEPSLGNLPSPTISRTVEEYDPATDRWTTKAPLPVGLHHVGLVSLGDRLYLVGGYTRSWLSVWSPVASLYMYDPAADRWTEGPAMPTARGALAVAVWDGKLYAIGGYDGTANVAAVEEYDPAGRTWKARAPLPTPRDHLAAASAGGRIYAIGGRLNQNYGRNVAVVEVYDPQADRWSKAADLPVPRSGLTASVLRGTIYALGGEAPEGTFRDNDAYVPGQDRWQSMAPMPTGRHGLGSAVVNERLYVLCGGPKPGGSYSHANEMFLPPDLPRSGSRATPQQVGTVMALLATFEAADVLPPESSPEANRLIRALIQFQAALMKSDNQAVRQVLEEALSAKVGGDAPAAVETFRASGWTSQSLEALIQYLGDEAAWARPGLEEGFGSYNVGRRDFELLARVFLDARQRLTERGQDLHRLYAARRLEMPGAEATP
ncbi:MAG: kelch repeat-containing protein [Nitrospirota bacterium]